MGEFDYFIRDIKLVRDINKGENELFWNVSIPKLYTFKELTDKFNNCMTAFENYLMSQAREDRGSIASLVINNLIKKLIEAKTCVIEDKQAPEIVKSLCEALEDGISTILDRMEKLDIELSGYLIEKMKELIRKEPAIMKKINGKITPTVAEEGFFMAKIFLPYLLNTNNINMFMPQKTDIKNDFPDELNTDKAKDLINKAIEFGLCRGYNGKYEWLKTNRLLAYFAEQASGYLKLGKGEYRGAAKTSWAPFEKLFQVEGLCNSNGVGKSQGTRPRGKNIVDKLFSSLGYAHEKRKKIR